MEKTLNRKKELQRQVLAYSKTRPVRDGLKQQKNAKAKAAYRQKHESDFSLSMSDVIVLHRGEQETAHYLDRGGYTEVPEFLQPEQAAQQEAQVDAPPVERPLTELQKQAVEIAKRYETLSMQEKIGVIAQAFGCTSGTIETSPCTGKWRGTSDISIRFDNGSSLFLGNHMTRQAKTKKVQQELVDSALVRYNPEIIRVAKETAYTALKERELQDNAIAGEKGLKPYTLLNVEFNDGTDQQSSGYIGWYYATLAVDGKNLYAFRNRLESRHCIRQRKPDTHAGELLCSRSAERK